MVVVIDYDKCCWKDGACQSCNCKGACEGCVEACPTGALIREDTIKIIPENCTDCALCISACEYEAIRIE
ncbi:4Fe-4S binding protein [Candidatus Woesearchaeota archaeon]|nr:4Fe-4S binding protein [Candidatus Woesearchaeota archaeon]